MQTVFVFFLVMEHWLHFSVFHICFVVYFSKPESNQTSLKLASMKARNKVKKMTYILGIPYSCWCPCDIILSLHPLLLSLCCILKSSSVDLLTSRMELSVGLQRDGMRTGCEMLSLRFATKFS